MRLKLVTFWKKAPLVKSHGKTFCWRHYTRDLLIFSKIHNTPMLTVDTDFPPKYTRRLKHNKLCNEFVQIFFELKICELNYLVP